MTVLLTVAGLSVASYAPWRFVTFVPLEQPSRAVLVIAAGLALLGVAGWMGLANRLAAKTIAGLVALVVAMGVCVGSVGAAMPDADHAVFHDRVAVSPDGRFELIRLSTSWQYRYRVRTRGWLFGREGNTDLACTPISSTQVDDSPNQTSQLRYVPTVRVEQARFADDTHVELRMTDSRSWTVGFNARSLRPGRFLNWCGSTEDEPR
ncbi:hypothetical protein AB0J72_55200 [Dactylosporangium sp. NPDC049742]|uniref:hypothetical protein n=1 Tax=Dactylosporangium sp. NPDC049742 TaxID=3154737 RepID=UPI003439CB17